MTLDDYFAMYAYLFVLFTCAFAGYLLWRYCHITSDEWKSLRRASISAALLTFIIGMSVRHEYRTLADETNLLGTSESMTFTKTVDNVVTSQKVYNIFQSTVGLVPKRPLLFPFLESIVHTLFGYQVMAGVWVNLAALFLLLVLAQDLPLQLLIVSHPVISMYACSGGFDLLAAALLVCSFLAARELTLRKTKASFYTLIACLLLLINCRYESLGYAGLILITLILFKVIHWPLLKESWKTIGLALMLSLPVFIQPFLSMGGYENGERALFSLQNAHDNLKVFFHHIWFSGRYLPYNNVINALSFLFVPLFYFKKFKERKFCLELLLMAACFSIVMLHIAGNIREATQCRYFIIYCIFTAYVFRQFIHKEIALLVGIIMFLWFHPIAMEDKIHLSLTLNRELRYEMQFLEKHVTEKSMIVSDRPGLFSAQRIATTAFMEVNNDDSQKELEGAIIHHLIDHVFVFQHVNFKNETVTNETRMPLYNIKALERHQITPEYFLQIGEILPRP